MKKIIFLLLIIVLFAGCTQNNETPDEEKNNTVVGNNTIVENNKTITENTEYTKELNEIESEAVECYYEDESEQMLTKLYGENLRINYITAYENTEMIFKSDENLWYIKSDKNSQFDSLGLDEDCVWIMWDMGEINSKFNKENETSVMTPSIFNLQKPTKDKMYCKEGDFGIEIFTPSEKICDMTEIIIKIYSYKQ